MTKETGQKKADNGRSSGQVSLGAFFVVIKK